MPLIRQVRRMQWTCLMHVKQCTRRWVCRWLLYGRSTVILNGPTLVAACLTASSTCSRVKRRCREVAEVKQASANKGDQPSWCPTRVHPGPR